MSDSKLLLITASTALSRAVASAFASMFIEVTVLSGCARFSVQDRMKYKLVLLDLDSLGPDKVSELRGFLAKANGLPVLAMCDMTRTSNGEVVRILSTGVNDVMPNAIDMNVLVAKTKSHLRRLGVNNPANDRAAGNLNRQ